MQCTLQLSASIAEENVLPCHVDILQCFVFCEQVIIPAILPCLYLTKLSLRLTFKSEMKSFIRMYQYRPTFVMVSNWLLFSCIFLLELTRNLFLSM